MGNSESVAAKKTPLIEENAATRELAAFSLNSLTQYGKPDVPRRVVPSVAGATGRHKEGVRHRLGWLWIGLAL